MTNKLTQTGLGVREAFDFWLSQHDISVPQMVEDAIGKAMHAWLEEHRDELIEAFAKRSKIVAFRESGGEK